MVRPTDQSEAFFAATFTGEAALTDKAVVSPEAILLSCRAVPPPPDDTASRGQQDRRQSRDKAAGLAIASS